MRPTGVYGYAGADGRPFAAASVKHGIVVGEVSLVTLPTHRHSEDGRLHPTSASDASNKVSIKLTHLFGLVVIGNSQSFLLSCQHCSHHVSFQPRHITSCSITFRHTLVYATIV